ncbi:MAG: hypothetical protein ACKVG1_08520, partial [Rhodospirillales bacterium]
MIKLKLVKIEALDEPHLNVADARDTRILAKEAPRPIPEERGPDCNDYAVPKSVPKPELTPESKKPKGLPQLVKIESVDEPDLKFADTRDTRILAKKIPRPVTEERGPDCNDYAALKSAPKPVLKPELKPKSKKPKLLPPRLRNPKQKEGPPTLETPKQAEQVAPTAPTVPPQPKPVPRLVPKPAGGSG